MRIPFHPLSESEFEQLLKSDEAYAYTTRGHGLSDINVFSTRRRRLQHGHGFFKNLIAKYGPKLIPLVKKYLFPATKRFASNIASDVLNGEKLKTSLKNGVGKPLKILPFTSCPERVSNVNAHSRAPNLSNAAKDLCRANLRKNVKNVNFRVKKEKSF